MKFQDYLQKILNEEAQKHIDRYHVYHNAVHLEFLRNQKRIENPPQKKIKKPNYWKLDPKFNPFYVRRKSKSIAKSIARKVASGNYQPFSPYEKKIPKPDGGERPITVYQIPDAAISRVYFERLLAKNRHRFSAFSYAYRDDKNVHFAIQDISLDISRDARVFVAEFDFSDFFGSISHAYLEEQFGENGFLISEEERHVISAFLKDRPAGIPQGTSISLFLANLVCWRMDHALERAGLKFARYADDTIVWAKSYEKICEGFSIINDFSASAGVRINAKKSDGISLLTSKGLPAELASAKSRIDFLGYSVSVGSVSIKRNSVKKIQKQISYLLYRNLIQPLKGSKLRGLVIPSNDSDEALLTAISQIRRYLYGGLSGDHLRDYLNGRTKRIYFKGIMSFYPLVNDEKQLKELDGWLVSTIHRCVQLRNRLLKKWGYDRSHSFPFSVAHSDILEVYRAHEISGKRLLEVPSFLLVFRAIQIGLINRGIENIMNPESMDYDY